MPRYTNTQRHPITVDDGRVVGAGETTSLGASALVAQLVADGALLEAPDEDDATPRFARPEGVASDAEVAGEPARMILAEPTPEQAASDAERRAQLAAQQQQDENQPTRTRRRSTGGKEKT